MQPSHLCPALLLAAAISLPCPALADGWRITITQEGQGAPARVAAPTAAAAKDSHWTALVVAVETPKATSSAVKAGEDFRPAQGPGLTGHAHALSGMASYYWQGQKTATGEEFDKRALTAAHKTLPFGTKVRVTRLDTGKSVVVRINDRGPFKAGRVIDLSERAAEEIKMTGSGVTAVKLEVLE